MPPLQSCSAEAKQKADDMGGTSSAFRLKMGGIFQKTARRGGKRYLERSIIFKLILVDFQHIVKTKMKTAVMFFTYSRAQNARKNAHTPC